MNGFGTSALVDSAATDCFIQSKFITSDIHQENVNIVVHTASNNKIMKITCACTLPVTIAGQTDSIRFLICDELNSEVTLGKTWLKAQKVIHDHDLDCLYIGVDSRRRVYLSYENNTTPKKCQAPPSDYFNDINQNFPIEYTGKLKNLLTEYADVFYRTGPLRQTSYIVHDIELTDGKPFRIPPYRYSIEKKRAIQTQVREMLADGLIEPSSSPYCSPIVMAKKKNGEYRFCIDFRRLNSITVSRAQNLPIIQEVVKDIGNAKVFTTLDLKSGYWQIKLTDRAKPYTAFSIPGGGLYQWRVMSFGLKNAPGCFNDFVTQEVLSGYTDRFIKSYLDDFVVYSDTWDQHIFHLNLIFERLRIYELSCSVSKCFFGYTNLEFLGFEVKSGGNEAKPEHVRAILEAPIPTSRKGLRKFFGICGWLREFIPNFAVLALPLTALLSRSCAWRWGKEELQAFNAIKQAFSTPLMLYRPERGKRLFLQTDACKTGMGAVLFQYGENGERRVIAYASAKFTKVEARYHSNEQECLAVIWAVKRFRHYLEDGNFTLRTDNRALTWLDNIKDGKGKLHRWAMYLRGFDFNIEHIAGKDNELPDALSREPGNNIYADNTEELEALLPPEREMSIPDVHIASTIAHDLHIRIVDAQATDFIDFKEIERVLQPGQRLEYNKDAYYVFENQRTPRIFVPYSCRAEIISYYHEDPLASHPGINETLRTIREHYFWPRMREDVRRAINNCQICLLAKASKPIAQGEPRPREPFTPWDTVAIDFMGPYPRTSRGKRFILVVTDTMSRWVEAFPISNSEIKTIAPILESEVFMRWGYPRVILSDNAPQFRGPTWKKYCDAWGAQIYTSPAYHARANPTERRNQEIKKGLRIKLMGRNQREWDLHLPAILFGLRRRENRNTGQTPSYMLLGRTLSRPGEWALPYSSETQDRVDQARQRQSMPVLQKTDEENGLLQPGDLVMAKNFALSNAAEGFNAGLAPRYTGPFRVLERCGKNVYILERPGQEHIKLHVSALKRVHRQISGAEQQRSVPPSSQLAEVTTPPALDPATGAIVKSGAVAPSSLSTTVGPAVSAASGPPRTADDADPAAPDTAALVLTPAATTGSGAPTETVSVTRGWAASDDAANTPVSQAFGVAPILAPRRRGRPTKAEAAQRLQRTIQELPVQSRYFLRSRERP